MEEIWPAVASLSGVLGALVVAVFNRLERRVEHRDEARRELEGALAAYLFALDTLAADMAALPKDAPGPRTERIMRWLGLEKVVYMLSLGFQRGLVGSRWDELGDRYVAASARMLLVADEPLVAAIRKIEGHLVAGRSGTTDAWRLEYRGLRERLDLTIRSRLERF